MSIEEIGILETNIQIEKYLEDKELTLNISKYIPISTHKDTKSIINNVLSKLINYKKKNILMLSNEFALIEQLIKYKNYFNNIIIVLSRNLSPLKEQDIKNNIPKDMNIYFIKELEFPSIIKPKDSLILVFGYKSGNNCLLSKTSYRMLEIYKNFLGEKIFVSCSKEDINQRPKNWIIINKEKYFTKIIWGKNEE